MSFFFRVLKENKTSSRDELQARESCRGLVDDTLGCHVMTFSRVSDQPAAKTTRVRPLTVFVGKILLRPRFLFAEYGLGYTVLKATVQLTLIWKKTRIVSVHSMWTFNRAEKRKVRSYEIMPKRFDVLFTVTHITILTASNSPRLNPQKDAIKSTDALGV